MEHTYSNQTRLLLTEPKQKLAGRAGNNMLDYDLSKTASCVCAEKFKQ